MGDRIAVLREGGHLAQFDTPDAMLAHPVDDFVARFVGADRELKRLSLRRLTDLELPAASGSEPYERISCRTTLRDALSIMLSEPERPRVVVDGDGKPAGLVTVDAIGRALGEGRRL